MAGGTVNIKLRGLEEVIAKLNKIDANLTGKGLIEAVTDAATILEDEIRARAPYDPKHRAGKGPHMRDTIKSRISASDLTKVTITTGPQSKLWWLVEYGHKNARGGGTTPAWPFIRPAFEAKSDAAIEAFWDKCDKLIAKAGVTS